MMQEYLEIAHLCLNRAGDILRAAFRQHGMIASLKGDDSPVTQADREVEMELRDILRAAFPHHGIIGEEYEREGAAAEYQWLIDPIDGTRAFACGLPTFGTLLGLMYQGRMLLGMMEQPISRERWVGVFNGTSTYNDHPIRTSDCTLLRQARLATTSPYLFHEQEKPFFEAVRNATAIQSYGGDCYNYMLLASGHVDVVIEAGLKPYDILPLIPILKGAGAIITDWQGQELDLSASLINVLVSANEMLHQELLHIVG